MQRKRFITVGDTVSWRGNHGRDKAKLAVVTSIELHDDPAPDPDEKGKEVKQIHNAFKNRCVFIVVPVNGSCRFWAYGDQIVAV